MQPISLHELLVDQISYLYDAEERVGVEFLTMAEASAAADLEELLRRGAEATKLQRSRLERIWRHAAKYRKRERKTCFAMLGLAMERRDLLESHSEASICDAGLIDVAQREIQYQISAYRSARGHARVLEMRLVEELLTESLGDEITVNNSLTRLAAGILRPRSPRSSCNSEAARLAGYYLG